MKRKDVLGNPIPLRLDPETEALVDALVSIRGDSKAEVMRSLIREGARSALMNESGATDQLLHMVRKAVSETNKPFEDRVAKLMAKASITSGTAMYTTIEALGQLGVRDIKDIYIGARKKAVAFLKVQEDPDQGKDEES